MAELTNFFRRLIGAAPAPPPRPRPSAGNSIGNALESFAEGDRVLVRSTPPTLTAPLKKGGKSRLFRGSMLHEEIIGKRPRDTGKSIKGIDIRLAYPTLEEYVTLTPRKVTPIYAHDANLIVSLLDLHVPAPATHPTATAPFEILESGTGHGSLTLHLARAIHAANTHPPSLPPPDNIESIPEPEERELWKTWRDQRRAILHTVDISPTFSAHAETIVKGFRRGMYAPAVDFYVSSIDAWIKDQITKRQTSSSDDVTPFLSHAILDMPDVQRKLHQITPLIKQDGLLLVFTPSVTQIGDCVIAMKDAQLPFAMEKTVELGTGISSGRVWDVRLAFRKAARKKKGGLGNSVRDSVAGITKEDTGAPVADADSISVMSEEGAATTEEVVEEVAVLEDEGIDMGEEEASKPVLVCRPKVGEKILNGGFVAVFRKTR